MDAKQLHILRKYRALSCGWQGCVCLAAQGTQRRRRLTEKLPLITLTEKRVFSGRVGTRHWIDPKPQCVTAEAKARLSPSDYPKGKNTTSDAPRPTGS